MSTGYFKHAYEYMFLSIYAFASPPRSGYFSLKQKRGETISLHNGEKKKKKTNTSVFP